MSDTQPRDYSAEEPIQSRLSENELARLARSLQHDARPVPWWLLLLAPALVVAVVALAGFVGGAFSAWLA